jgi:hypothetical protein
VTVAALLLWLCTIAVGSYLLVTAAHSGNNPASAESEPAEPVRVPADQAAGAAAGTASPTRAKQTRDERDAVFAPPSLQRARDEPLPGLKDFAEFTHPALAMIGIGFWLGYLVSHRELFAVIGLGIVLGTICAGIWLFTVNTRAARRAAAAEAESGAAASGPAPLTAPPLVLILHGAGAALTLLFVVLIAVRG